MGQGDRSVARIAELVPSEFSRRYRLELEGSDSAGPFLEEIGKHRVVTLLYASKNAAENHALILKDFIEESGK